MNIIKLANINHYQYVISIYYGNNKQLYRLSFSLLGKSYAIFFLLLIMIQFVIFLRILHY